MEYLESTFKLKVKQLQWQKRGLQQTATGYGSRLTTEYMILPDGGKIWLRVYACCYSNAASFYILPKRSTVWIRDWQLQQARDDYRAGRTQ